MKKTFNFISASDRLPEKSGMYLCITFSGCYFEVHYSAKHQAFNAYDWQEDVSKGSMSVDYWAAIPGRKVDP